MDVMNQTNLAIQLTKQGISINGKPTVILCASLFYFRIPREQWRDRMQKVKKAGYNCIDVYFPWNFHETEPDRWDFSSDKDAETFLQMAAEEGLYVVARPGPYICSEWDGGALPAYLLADENIRLRDNDPVFLKHVGRWFDRIFPLLKKYQIGQMGSIIMVQLENELDFYSCQDPAGYISALRDMAQKHGVEVPLIACAGQGDLLRATGHSQGVIPTCNFYPNDRDPEFESKVHSYAEQLGKQNLPLLVTETNRSHFLLRRLFAAGAKLLGPYLQVSGNNFGFTNGVNNWGDPLSLLTSDYDFGGMISPAGEMRAEAFEGRLLSRVIQAAGQFLVKSQPLTDHGFSINGAPRDKIAGPNVLALEGGGYLYSLPNVSDEEQELCLHEGGQCYPQYTALSIPERRCPLLLAQVPLRNWGLEHGVLEFASAELIDVKSLKTKTVFVFHGEGESEFSFQLKQFVDIETNGSLESHLEKDSRLVLTAKEGAAGTAAITFESGHMLEIRLLKREQALKLVEVTPDGEFIYEDDLNPGFPAAAPPIHWNIGLLSPGATELGTNRQLLGPKAEFLEKRGIYKGFAWYTGSFKKDESNAVKGILLKEASDICSVYTNGEYQGTVVPGGGSAYIPLKHPISNQETELLVRSEVWGHSNFDDARLPAFRLNSRKGMTGAVAVTEILPLNSNWRFQLLNSADQYSLYSTISCPIDTWPIVNWGSWMTLSHPSHGCYRKEFLASKDSDDWILHLPGIRSLSTVYVNGEAAGKINPLTPYLDITRWIKPGKENQLTLFLETYYGLETGKVILYEGVQAFGWELSSAGEKELWQQALKTQSATPPAKFPIGLNPGEAAWLFGKWNGGPEEYSWSGKCTGKNLKLTIFLNGRLIGRLWMPSPSRPQMRGGNETAFYIPGAWIQGQENTLAIMLESTERAESGVLEEFEFNFCK